MNPKHAAIDPDEVLDKPLEEISAAQLISALGHPKAEAFGLRPHVITDKKKIELWVEEGPIFKEVTLREILERLHSDKKKLELERPPDWREWHVQPDPTRAQLVEEVAQLVQQRIGK